MKGFIKKAASVLCLGGGLAAAQGCYTYREIVDPCYPERYNFAARETVRKTFAPQVLNGHVLDQTVWNYHFEAGTDRLTPAGRANLLHLVRRRPHPDPVLYLATAQDIVYNPAAVDEFTQKRRDLDSRRIQAVQRYLTTQTAERGLAFQVLVHDPAETGQHAFPVNRSINANFGAAQGVLVIGAPPGAGTGGQGFAVVPVLGAGATAGTTGATTPAGAQPTGPGTSTAPVGTGTSGGPAGPPPGGGSVPPGM